MTSRPTLPESIPTRAVEPRLLSKAEAAAYCGMTPHAFDRHRKAKRLPGYVPGFARFDRHAIDAALDELSKLGGLKAPAPAPAASAEKSDFDVWKRKRAERKSREALEDQAIRAGVDTMEKPGRGGRMTATYIHRATGQRLPYNPKHPAFRAAFARCEEVGQCVPGSKPRRS